MDVFLEYLIKRKYTSKEYIKVILFGIGSFVLAILLFLASMISYLYNPFLQQILFVALIADVYFGYVIVTRQNVEYEYALTNTYFDIDRIIAKRRREDVLSIDVREIKEMDSLDLCSYKSDKNKYKDYEIYGNIDSSAYYIIYDDNGETHKVIFNPPTKMVEGMKKFIR
ncbi:MAG: hypothetical protein E7396_03575 [Ruminococcaceae bacterium]|nr:hypothetical protein [Oscillospiraceae bacterium]